MPSTIWYACHSTRQSSENIFSVSSSKSRHCFYALSAIPVCSLTVLFYNQSSGYGDLFPLFHISNRAARNPLVWVYVCLCVRLCLCLHISIFLKDRLLEIKFLGRRMWCWSFDSYCQILWGCSGASWWRHKMGNFQTFKLYTPIKFKKKPNCEDQIKRTANILFFHVWTLKKIKCYSLARAMWNWHFCTSK